MHERFQLDLEHRWGHHADLTYHYGVLPPKCVYRHRTLVAVYVDVRLPPNHAESMSPRTRLTHTVVGSPTVDLVINLFSLFFRGQAAFTD